MYPFSLIPDFRNFHAALFLQRPYEPRIKESTPSREASAKQSDPNIPKQKFWHLYYSICIGYVTSLHNQFVAVLSIQGGLAIGCLAAVELIKGNMLITESLGGSVAAMELALTILAMKLFRQHCVICWMLRDVEQNELGIPAQLGMKTRLGTAGNRLFTSPLVYIVTLLYGIFLAGGLGVATFLTSTR